MPEKHMYRTYSIIRPPFMGGGRLIEVCTNAPSLRPPPPPPPPPRNAKSGFRVTVILRGSCRESRGCHKITVHNSQQLQTRDGRIVGHVPQNW